MRQRTRLGRMVCVLVLAGAVVLVGRGLAGQATESALGPHVADAFATGWMLVDTNGNGIADAIQGQIVVPARPTAAENAAAANVAARLGYGSTGLTLPAVVNVSQTANGSPKIYIGKGAVPASQLGKLEPLISRLEKGEGGVFAAGDNLAIVGFDDGGLLAAADDYAARTPYQWKVPGEELPGIAKAVSSAASGVATQLIGVTYEHGKQGIRRAFLHADSDISQAALQTAISSKQLAAVQELIVFGGASPVSVTNPKPMAAEHPAPSGAANSGSSPQNTGAASAEATTTGESPARTNEPTPEPSRRLDLATLYTSKGLFNGTPKMPIPSSLDAHLYVPGGPAGTAMANLAARMGMETTGITLPLASPADEAKLKDVKSQPVIAGDSALAQEAEKKLRAEDTADAESESALAPGEGEVRMVDDAFPKHGAILVKGDTVGSVAALDLLSGRFPNLWEPGKQHLSLENIRYDLHRFFSLHSSAGQAAAALYHLDRWAKEINQADKWRSGRCSERA